MDGWISGLFFLLLFVLLFVGEGVLDRCVEYEHSIPSFFLFIRAVSLVCILFFGINSVRPCIRLSVCLCYFVVPC